MRKELLFSLVIILALSHSSNAETVTTTDGRTIQLNEDGTYEILQIENDGYENVDIVDLHLEKDKWSGKSVRVRGAILNGSDGDIVGFYQDQSMTGVSFYVDISGVPTATRRLMLTSCSVLCRDVEVVGVFADGWGAFKVHDVEGLQ